MSCSSGCSDTCPVPGDWGKALALPVEASVPVLALGAELKSTICFALDKRAWIYDCGKGLADAETYRRFRSRVQAVLEAFKGKPLILARDMHPQFLSAELAEQLHRDHADTIRIEVVQHHHAHAAACMAEHGITDPVWAIACDGTGYGDDGSTWGGELLHVSMRDYSRAASLCQTPLPGGDVAAVEIWRTALGMVHLADPPVEAKVFEELFSGVDSQALQSAVQMLRANLNCPLSSGLGRVFDACAFVLGLAFSNDFEGQAPIRLEEVARSFDDECAGMQLPGIAGISELLRPQKDVLRMDTPRLIRELALMRVSGSASVEELAALFHYVVAELFAEALQRVRAEKTDVPETVLLTGGCFLNKILTRLLTDRLGATGMTVLRHERTSPGDAAISFGQAFVAAFRQCQG